PLGILPLPVPDGVFPETELRLDGGTLYLFTDGVTEGYTDGGAPLEVEGLKALIRKNAALTLAGRVDAVINRLRHGTGALRDDLTVLAIEDRRQAENG
ncbi:MAG: SpoIIE family protein phosphatase, partial [Alphaproteobacteria bacterium]